MPGNENMASMPPAHDLKNPEEILGDLLNLARANKPALDVFNVYIIDAAFEENLKTLKALPEKPLEAAAELLGASPKVAGKKRYQNRTTLAEWIIMRISALFPYECGACEEYQVERLAKPKRRCHQCGQGSHDCQPFLDSLKVLGGALPAGYVWLCHPCGTKDRIEAFNDYEPGEVNSDDEYLNRISPSQNKKGKRKRKAAGIKGEPTITPVNTDPDQDARRTLKLNLGESSTQEGTLPEDDVPSGQPEDTKESSSKPEEKRASKGSKKDKVEKFENVCEAFKRQACPHGRKGDQLVEGKPCPKNHPPVCGRYISHGRTRKVGCAKGADCPRYHPPICRGSEIKRQCFDKDCDRIHLKFTRRTPDLKQSNASAKTDSKNADKAPAKRPDKKKAADVPPKTPRNNTKTGVVDQDFLLTTLGILREGMMEELVQTMGAMIKEQMDEIRTIMTPPGVLERFRQRSSPLQLGSSVGETPKSKATKLSYVDIVKHSPRSSC